MMPNIDPRQLKNMMSRMGIKSTEIDAVRVIIEGKEIDIVIENPQVMEIDAQGSKSYQISGEVREVGKVKLEVSDADVKLVMEQSGIGDEGLVRKALEETNGDIAEAIMRLKEQQS